MTRTARTLPLALALAAALAGPVGATAATAAAAPAGPSAASAPEVQVDVAIGADLRSEEARYGAREFPVLSDELKRAVAKAAAQGGFSRLDLVIEYARPNRPTFNQLGLDPSLSFDSLAIGGATVTGRAVRADGRSQPLKFSWYESDLALEYGPTTWSDAFRAFQLLAVELKRGRVPDKFGPGRLTPRPYLDRRTVF